MPDAATASRSVLYIFDLDGTLIEGFLEEVRCPQCSGRGVVLHEELPAHVKSDSRMERCPQCRGKTTWLRLTEAGYDRITFLPGRVERLRELVDAGHQVAIATNQTGVAYGFQTEEQVLAKLTAVEELLEVHVHTEVCMDPAPGLCRKPAPCMLSAAMRDAGVPKWETIFIGDMETDQQAAVNAGTAFQWSYDFFGDDVDRSDWHGGCHIVKEAVR